MLGDPVQQAGGLQPVTAGPAAGLLDHPAVIDGFLHRRHDQADAELGDTAVTEVEDLGEVVPGVHVHDRKRDARGREGPLRQGEHDDRVLAAGEQQHRPLELGGDLAHHVNRLGLKNVELREQVVGTRHGHQEDSGLEDVRAWLRWPSGLTCWRW